MLTRAFRKSLKNLSDEEINAEINTAVKNTTVFTLTRAKLTQFLAYPAHLTKLDLSHNNLTELPQGLNSLKYLNISYNKLQYISLGHIPQCLEVLNISHNKINEIGDVKGVFPNLTYLNFGYNRFILNPFKNIENIFPNLEYCYTYNRCMETAIFVEKLPRLKHMQIVASNFNSDNMPKVFPQSLVRIDITLFSDFLFDSSIWETCPNLRRLSCIYKRGLIEIAKINNKPTLIRAVPLTIMDDSAVQAFLKEKEATSISLQMIILLILLYILAVS